MDIPDIRPLKSFNAIKHAKDFSIDIVVNIYILISVDFYQDRHLLNLIS